VGSDLLAIFLLSLLACLNPSLLAAVTVMLLLKSPMRPMFGYLLGAYMTSITCGLIIVFSLQGTETERVARTTIGPLEDIALGLIAIGIAWILSTGRDRPLRERRQAKKDAKLEAKREAGKPTESLSLRMLEKGSPKVTFVVGAVLTFPGVSYLLALGHIHNLQAGVAPTVLLVVYFCMTQLLLLELPVLGYLLAPESTAARVSRFRNWMVHSGRRAAIIGSAAIGAWLLIRGVLGLL
jgi:hypothetical protein